MIKPTKYFGCTWRSPYTGLFKDLGGTGGGIEPQIVDPFSLLLGGITTEKMPLSLITRQPTIYCRIGTN